MLHLKFGHLQNGFVMFKHVQESYQKCVISIAFSVGFCIIKVNIWHQYESVAKGDEARSEGVCVEYRFGLWIQHEPF